MLQFHKSFSTTEKRNNLSVTVSQAGELLASKKAVSVCLWPLAKRRAKNLPSRFRVKMNREHNNSCDGLRVFLVTSKML